MPAQQKKVIFCIAGVLSFACALGIAAAVGTQLWIKGTILCKTGALLVNATGPELEKFIGEIQYGLFYGERVRQCGLGGRPFRFSFFPDLLKIIPASIHVSVILFCTVLIVFALVGTGFFMYNAFGNPYETLHGPVGLYLWSFISYLLLGNSWSSDVSCSISGSCSCLIMILFSSEVKIHHLSEKIANYKEGSFIFKTHNEQFQDSFWIILVCSLVHFLNVLLIRLAGFEFPFSKSKESETTTTGAADLMY
ncbi:clarin-1 isoform X1 [Malaclemys terrapin pileata]|uniref:clarin-1 isoform X1 n=1 Tax=Chrysemys picta bellii TaxID=8478 RepID=UPI000388ABC2|nr:clarin-1 isoform X2 [Chrysemys picta bellii]XP_053895110.1 clarin-1 isoform X1 [Malaclemys terrapin pileata]